MKHLNYKASVTTIGLAAIAIETTQIVLLVLGIISTIISISNSIYKTYKENKQDPKKLLNSLDKNINKGINDVNALIRTYQKLKELKNHEEKNKKNIQK